MIQIISLVGSLSILAAYSASQFKLLSASTLRYSLLNFVGSGILAVVAIIESQWGFLLLEGVWSLISLWSTIKILRGGKIEAVH